MCKISVVVPVFNGKKYLCECLDSICNQTLEDIEIICVNDGSTDETLSILNEYASKDSRIRILSTEHKGQGHARNRALEICVGEYISFVDADDWIDLKSFELLYESAKSNDLELLFFQMINYIDDSKKFVETDLYNHKCFDENIEFNTCFNHNDTEKFLFEIPVCPVSKLYKKKFLDNYKIKFPEGIFFEDNCFFYETYFKCDKAGFLPKQLYFRRRHNESVTQIFDERKMDIIYATNQVLNIFFENNFYELYKVNVINHTFSMVMEWFKKSPLSLKQNFFALIKKDFEGFNNLKLDFYHNLNKDFLLIFELMDNNRYYIDFLSEYKIATSKYCIFNGFENYDFGSNEYYEYKLNQPDKKYAISVIIPIHNTGKLIHRTLTSILNQTLGVDNIEVLLINDCSTDDTVDIINDYVVKYDSFKAIHIENGSGSPGTPRNIGLIESSSNWIIFLDHDDFLDNNALDLLYSTITDVNCDVIFGTYVVIDNNIPTKIIYPNEKHGYFENICENERLIAFPPPSIWTKLFNKSFLYDNHLLFPTILGEDAIFMSKSLMLANGINYLWDSSICFHDLNSNSYTNNISYNYLEEGFVSEEYLYNLYKNSNKEHFYKIRGEGIYDFYLSQFYKSNLSKNEIIKIFPLLYVFVYRLHSMGLSPHVSELNVLLSEYILNKDMESILNLKIPPVNNSSSFKLKNLLKKFLDIW